MSADVVAMLRAHLPRNRYDDDGDSIGTECTCGEWSGGYFADGEAGPFDDHLAAALEPLIAARVREAEQRGAEKVHARVEAAISNTDASWGGAAMVVRDKVRVALTPERKRTSDHTETAAEFIARADRLAGDER